MRTAPGSSNDNQDFQSWITRVRVLKQNDAEIPDKPEAGNPDQERTLQANAPAPSSFLAAASTASTPPAKPVQSSRDWSQTAKKALDEMLVTLPDDQPADWSSSYPRQPIATPPAKPALPLYAKVLLPVMGLALSAYPLFFAAQKGWIPGISGNETSQITIQQRQAGQTPAPLSVQPGQVRSTTPANRGGFKLATSKPAAAPLTTSLVVSRPPAAPVPVVTPEAALPAPIAPQQPVRATLLRPETAAIPAIPAQTTPAQPAAAPPGKSTDNQAPGAAAGWTTQISRQVSNPNPASLPITVENVKAVGPTLTPAAPPIATRAANNSIELPSETLAVGGPVIPLAPNQELPSASNSAAGTLTIQRAPTRLAAIAPSRPAPAVITAPRVRQVPTAPINRVAAPVQNTGALLERGNGLLKLGDVVSARLFFELAAKAGDPAGALAAGRTYDPLYLNRMGVLGIKADPARALTWYRTARRGGNTGAAGDILRLESSAAR